MHLTNSVSYSYYTLYIEYSIFLNYTGSWKFLLFIKKISNIQIYITKIDVFLYDFCYFICKISRIRSEDLQCLKFMIRDTFYLDYTERFDSKMLNIILPYFLSVQKYISA